MFCWHSQHIQCPLGGETNGNWLQTLHVHVCDKNIHFS